MGKGFLRPQKTNNLTKKALNISRAIRFECVIWNLNFLKILRKLPLRTKNNKICSAWRTVKFENEITI